MELEEAEVEQEDIEIHTLLKLQVVEEVMKQV